MAAVQEMLPNPIRAQSTALYLAFVNMVSQGLGPTVVALTTDFIFHDPAALRYSLAMITPLLLIAAMGSLVAGLRPFRATKAAALK